MKKSLKLMLASSLAGSAVTFADENGTAVNESSDSGVAPAPVEMLPDAKEENQQFADELKTVVGGRLTYEERIKRLNENGGNEKVEAAILRSLNWLANRQKEDGSWEETHTVAMTGLALLAYLGHGDIPGGDGEFTKAASDAIDYLIGVSQKNEGFLTSDPKDRGAVYEHAIATYALSEAYILGITQDHEIKGLPEAIVAGANRIVKIQAENGSWGYKATKAGDLSVVAWNMQALKAASHTGLPVEGLRQSSEKAMQVLGAYQKEDGSFAYLPNKKEGGLLTGAGVLCHQQWGTGSSTEASLGVSWLDNNVSFKWSGSGHVLYNHYYIGQVMFEHGGEAWEKYNNGFRDPMLERQNEEGSFAEGKPDKKDKQDKPERHDKKSKKGKNDKKDKKEDSRDKPRKGGIRKHGEIDFTPIAESDLKYTWQDHYHNCLSTLMLEVYFRYLPGTNER